MKTKILAVGCIALVAALFSAYNSQAQEPLPAPVPVVDLGEGNLLTLACQVSTIKALHEGVKVVYCRRGAPDAIEGNTAVITVHIKIKDLGVFVATTTFIKSLWSVESWLVQPVVS